MITGYMVHDSDDSVETYIIYRYFLNFITLLGMEKYFSVLNILYGWVTLRNRQSCI